MKLNKTFVLGLGLFVSFLIGTRSYEVGKDTETYVTHFKNSQGTSSILEEGFELGFSALMVLISQTTGSITLFFFIVAAIITLMYLFLFTKIYQQLTKMGTPSLGEYSIILTLLLLSSWYFTMTTNGIRQGLSLCFLYTSLFYLIFENKKLKFLLFYLIALSFHNSALLVLPLILIYKMSLYSILIIWSLFGIGYALGLNEILIESISNYLNIPLYGFVKSYGVLKGSSLSAPYEGFDLRFFIYTIFWPLLSIIAGKYYSNKKKITHIDIIKFNKISKLYLLLSIPYFVLGFGGFSNRYAILAWFLVPILQFSIINLKIVTLRLKNIEIVSLIIAFLYFCFFRLKWINFL